MIRHIRGHSSLERSIRNGLSSGHLDRDPNSVSCKFKKIFHSMFLSIPSKPGSQNKKVSTFSRFILEKNQ